MHPGRVDVIGAGALVWAEVITRVRAEVAAAGGELTSVVTSEHDILDGIALSAAA
jgi:exopolyphosphatase/guanosine-5'-triphosphate,3'-diphosphate pyrophosphatase